MNPQSMLDPAGPGAASIETMWWVLFWVCTAVFLLVMVALGLALFRRRHDRGGAPAGEAASEPDGPGAERRRVAWVLVAGAAIPAVILVGIFGYTMVVLDEIGPSDPRGDLTVVVTGKQYWWDVRYPLPGGDTVVTANEIHIPVGRRVEILLRSDDVIHSLWVPKLHGKTDMIPGRTNEMWLQADEPGIYRGQCAEYCGQQHTWMALFVVAESEDEFREWLARQQRPATGLATDARVRLGREVFLAPENRCADCHVVRGDTDVAGLTEPGAPGEPPGRTAEGPDLTHVASRLSLGAGVLTMNRGNMGGWITNPQVIKPGNLMPRVPLEPEEMNALLEYLMSLR